LVPFINPELDRFNQLNIFFQANITAIKIRGTYVPLGTGFLDEVHLGTAKRGGPGSQATWIER
jgi:hypothetical protein